MLDVSPIECSSDLHAHQRLLCGVQIEELQAQESQVRAAEAEGPSHGPVSALLEQLGASTPEETQAALQQLLHAAAAAR